MLLKKLLELVLRLIRLPINVSREQIPKGCHLRLKKFVRTYISRETLDHSLRVLKKYGWVAEYHLLFDIRSRCVFIHKLMQLLENRLVNLKPQTSWIKTLSYLPDFGE